MELVHKSYLEIMRVTGTLNLLSPKEVFGNETSKHFFLCVSRYMWESIAIHFLPNFCTNVPCAFERRRLLLVTLLCQKQVTLSGLTLRKVRYFIESSQDMVDCNKSAFHTKSMCLSSRPFRHWEHEAIFMRTAFVWGAGWLVDARKHLMDNISQ